MKEAFDGFIKTILFGAIFFCIFYYVLLPKIIENRAQHLDLLKYNSKIDKMVEKDSLFISGWDLYYLKNGTFNGYNGY